MLGRVLLLGLLVCALASRFSPVPKKNYPKPVVKQIKRPPTDFKGKISHIITDIQHFKTPEGIRLTAELTNRLFAIHNILQQQYKRSQLPANSHRNNPQHSAKILKIYVNRFMQTVQKTQAYLEKHSVKSIKGNGNVGIGEDNLITGKGNKVKGSNNKVIGDSNLVSGESTMLRGNSNSLIGNDMFVMGNNNIAKGNNTVIFSFGNKSHRNNSLVIGDYTIDLNAYMK